MLKKIHAGAITMHSRSYFLVRAILIGTIAFLLLAGFFFLLSFIFFSVRESGLHFLLEFSERGLGTFVILFPWLTLLFALALLIILEALLRHFRFGYRLPLLRIFLWLVIIGAIGSTLLGLSPLHSYLLSKADNGQLPVLGSWYEQIHDSHQQQGIYRGDITSITQSYFTISHNDTDRDSDEGTWNIIPPSGFDLRQLVVGNKVYIAARVRGGIMYAYGIRIIPKDE